LARWRAAAAATVAGRDRRRRPGALKTALIGPYAFKAEELT
jgi:hypothetical protein